jgi:hypothetical protein
MLTTTIVSIFELESGQQEELEEQISPPKKLSSREAIPIDREPAPIKVSRQLKYFPQRSPG